MKKKLLFILIIILVVVFAVGIIFLLKNLKETVIMEGVAVNGKAGAIIITEKTGPVYLDRIDSWPDDKLDKKIMVEGSELVNIKYIEDSVIGEDGGISQGAEGTQWVLKNPKW
ncbi:MAG TPA: hypothetical protein DEB09_03115 [Candidatus Magasanikbacteria bacterium]|nr:hypothetical protein [Candidatus Magasanikbacteria bacterium]